MLRILITFVVWVWLIFFPIGINIILPFLASKLGDSTQARVINHHIDTAPLGQDINGKSHQHYILNVEFNNKGRTEYHDLEMDSGDLFKNIVDDSVVRIHYFSFFPYRPALDEETNTDKHYSIIFLSVIFIISIFGLLHWSTHLGDGKKAVQLTKSPRLKKRRMSNPER